MDFQKVYRHKSTLFCDTVVQTGEMFTAKVRVEKRPQTFRQQDFYNQEYSDVSHVNSDAGCWNIWISYVFLKTLTTESCMLNVEFYHHYGILKLSQDEWSLFPIAEW